MRQSLVNLLQTTTFRLGSIQAIVVIVVAIVLMSYVSLATSGQLLREADDAVRAEFETLTRSFGDGGMLGLRADVAQRAARSGGPLYYLVDPDGVVLVAETPEPPGTMAIEPRLVDFSYLPEGETSRMRLRGVGARLFGGPTLFVASDLAEMRRVQARLNSVLISVALLGLLLAVASGLFVARFAARRAEELSRTARDVMEGNLARRASVRPSGDEFDTLARDINAMLDRIERLVHTTRTAGEAIAHDLRTPLSRMLQRVEAALAQPEDIDQDREALRKVKLEADRILSMFASVLRLARIEQTPNWPMANVDITDMVRTMAEFYEPVAEEAGLSFEAETEDGLHARADEGLLVQALSNLIENAVKYTPEGGRIALRAGASRGGAVVISVLDDGPGIPAADRARAMERFVRLEAARASHGVGLGLSLVQAIAKLHGGDLSLQDGLGGPASPDQPGLCATITVARSIAA